MSLAGLLRPRSIALVGASDKSRWARMALRNIEGSGYTGALHIVNRRGGEVLGRQASVSCAAIGEPVDVALLLVPAAAIPSALDDLAAAGVRNAVLLSSGFAEAGEDGKRMQQALAGQATAAGITVLGPNCLGYYNFAGKAAIWTGTLPAGYPVGRIGIVSQSGAVANAIAHFCYQQGIGLSSMVSTGNEATLGIAPVIDDLLDDESTDVIGVFMETARDPAGFRAVAARAQQLGKPLVVLKVGRSEVTAKAAQAHTGALVGDDQVFDALCRQYGVVRVRSIEELAVTADVMARTGVLPGDGVGLVSISGGLSEISADLASDAGSVWLPSHLPPPPP